MVDNFQHILPVSAVVLAGGRGKRIGGNKLFLHVEGQAVLEVLLRRLSGWMAEMLLVVSPGEERAAEDLLEKLHRHEAVRVVQDRHGGLGPLAGLVRGMEAAQYDWIFALGCDMPDVHEAVARILWLRRLYLEAPWREYEAVLARIGGYLEPLHAFYRSSGRDVFQGLLAQGRRKIGDGFPEIAAAVVEEEDLSVIPGYRASFRNLNTSLQLAAWLRERRERE